MLSKIMNLIKILFFILLILKPEILNANEDFNNWVKNYKKYAVKQGVNQVTVDTAFKNVKFLERIITYDRRQPEFIEKTNVYIKKRINIKKIQSAKSLIKSNRDLLNKIEKEFDVPANYLVALWGIETHFGRHKGKVDIISALSTLSYDKRRSEFFSKELLILLRLIDKKIIKLDSLVGSWAGAHGNFQFMPSSIQNFAIDYDNNNNIDLYVSLNDSFASAANYLNKIGWDKNPWGFKVKLEKEINPKYIGIDARKLKKKLAIKKWKKLGVKLSDSVKINENLNARLIRPDGNSGDYYLVLNNYEKLLHWNRSLRFAITIGIFADYLKNV